MCCFRFISNILFLRIVIDLKQHLAILNSCTLFVIYTLLITYFMDCLLIMMAALVMILSVQLTLKLCLDEQVSK